MQQNLRKVSIDRSGLPWPARDLEEYGVPQSVHERPTVATMIITSMRHRRSVVQAGAGEYVRLALRQTDVKRSVLTQNYTSSVLAYNYGR